MIDIIFCNDDIIIDILIFGYGLECFYIKDMVA